MIGKKIFLKFLDIFKLKNKDIVSKNSVIGKQDLDEEIDIYDFTEFPENFIKYRISPSDKKKI